ncbi:hypothetical protein BJ165DRAFT_1525738 [Panaeolus papilionaceus]|nr:hypothetical protein BJ165DRAFT_1525738 [Panaeolus papilionaceus]
MPLTQQDSCKLLLNQRQNQISKCSEIGRDDIKWQELLLHFRTVQAKHEKVRRQALGSDTPPQPALT